jgi:protein involved in polysaccharide export with SLBB domain
MKPVLSKITTLFILLLYVQLALAQDIKSVDVNSLSQSEIDKAQKAMADAGLSPKEAADLARQKGASEQQIMEMEKRLQGSTDSTRNNLDPYQSSSQISKEDNTTKFSTRLHKQKADNPIFGSYLFNNKNLTFEPSMNIQTPSNYEINIGDEILVSIWGNSQNNYQLTVNQNGQILIPDIGPVYIAGLAFTNAEQKIKNRLTSIYADMEGDNPETFAQVNLGQLQAIRVNIVGEVNTPGTYTLPATASVFNALYLSGGPSDIGSYRNIRVIRGNTNVTNIDIYNFLINGDPSGNIQLKDNDVIFVPPVTKKVKINGYFNRNGIFELKENESLKDLIRFAGGYTEDAYLSKIQIQRKTQLGHQILDIDFNNIASTILTNGDSVSNTEINKEFKNRVTISGAVSRPGTYELTADLTLQKLISKADGLLSDAYKERGIVRRLNPDYTTTTISFDVNKVVLGQADLILNKEDSVIIKSHFQIGEMPFISIGGEVMEAGEFPWSENTTVSDLLFMAGGFTEAADSSYIEISRRLNYKKASELTDTLVHVFTINHPRTLETNENSFKLQAYDHVSVRSAPGFRAQGSATVAGEVVYAGVYALQTKSQRISDLLKLAKGITPQAFIDGATLRRNTEELGTENIAINLGEIIKQPKCEHDLYLKDGDILFIPEFAQTVKVLGAVQNPFSITFEEGKSLKYYIDKTGGFETDAVKRKVYVQYANGYTASTKSFIVKNYPKVKAGSQIVVPQKQEKKAGNGQWISIASVMASLAVSIATVVSLTN